MNLFSHLICFVYGQIFTFNSHLKPVIRSSVVSSAAPIAPIKSKEDLIKLQNKFNGSEQRNRRIFGVILGTLKEFKTDDKERSSTTQALHRKELEKKIEIKKVEDLKRIVAEKRQLQEEKYRRLRQIEIIEQKIQLTEEVCFDFIYFLNLFCVSVFTKY